MGSTRWGVLSFHGIGSPPRWVPVEEQRFWCLRRDWLAFADLFADVASTGSTVELTFDDGNASDVVVVLPSLLERGLTATFNVCAGRIGQPGYLDDAALTDLCAAGMGLGSHGWDHVDLRRLTDAELVHETHDSRERIADGCQAPVTCFAVPFGSYDRRVLRHLRGYSTVYTSDATSACREAWIVPRWGYIRGWSTTDVEDLIRGVESPRRRLRQHASMAVKRWR